MIFKIIVYVLFSSFGLIFLKMGAKNNFNVAFTQCALSIQINYILILGSIFYIASFITSLIIMKDLNLNVFYPVSAGLIYVIVCLLSKFLLNETISIPHIIGILSILLGIIIMNINWGK